MPRSRFLLAACLAASLCVPFLAGCDGGDPQPITQVEARAKPLNPVPTAEQWQDFPKEFREPYRLRVRMPRSPGDGHGGMGHGGMGHGGTGHGTVPRAGTGAGTALRFDVDLPVGWVRKPSRPPLRAVNLGVEGAPQIDAYLSLLGKGNEIVGNVNRWRDQMGAPDLSEADVEALPRKPLLGGEAVYLDVSGTFKGMGMRSAPPREGYRMLGLLLERDEDFVTFKLTGPAEAVAEQEAAFLAVAASLVQAKAETPERKTSPPPKGRLAWTTPKGWEPGKPVMFASASFVPAPGVTCTITKLAGPAGGLALNINRWRVEQLGVPSLSDDEIESLPRRKALDGEGYVVTIDGTWRDRGANETVDPARLLGFVIEHGGGWVFLKMVGPTAAVAAEEERFLALVDSLRIEP